MTKFPMVVVSNRLPVTVEKRGGELVYSQSDGGLATALSSVEVENRIWVGWPGIASDNLTSSDKSAITKELAKRNCFPVFLTASQIELFYEGYSNDTLWPLFHYFQSFMINRDDYWRSYRSVNKQYSEAIKRVASTDAKVWIHDYHLMLLPNLVRTLLPSALIGYFHHIPFPSFEVYRLLPERKELLEGLLGADLIGFHIFDYARHFLSSCLRLLGLPNDYGTLHVDGRIVKIDSFPISIDYAYFAALREEPDVVSSYASLLANFYGQKLIFSIDRLDYSKGILERLEGYKRFLEDNPKYLGQVTMLMIVSPSRTGVESYQQLQTQIEQSVSRINGQYGSAEWAPISYQFQTLALKEIVPMYMAADTMLVTPRRDGMNLVAKEYIASKGRSAGVLILSEMAGAVEELPEALDVNPNDSKAIAKAIKTSFEMPKKEKIERLKVMQGRIEEHDVKIWSKNFLTALDRVRKLQCEASVSNLSGETLKQMKGAFKTAKNRLLLLDYDGTLQTFKSSPSPSAAAPSDRLYSLIQKLAVRRNTTLVIVSGRSREALESWFGKLNIDLVAEHDAWRKERGRWQNLSIDFAPVKSLVLPVLKDYVSRTPGSKIEEKDFAIVWHYRNVPVELALVRAFTIAHELRAAIGDKDATVHKGNKIIEVKPENVSKRAAVESIIGRSNYDFILCAGDDYTDEDMFEVAPEASYTVKVGPGDTDAKYRVPTVAAMVRVLEGLVSD